jgi:hypothetical protein
MKTIYDSTLGKTTWRGEEYLVLGQPGLVESPCHLLAVGTTPAPAYNPATQSLDYVPHRMVGDDWIDGWEVRALTTEELTAAAQRDLIAMAYATAADAFATLDLGKQALWEPVRAKVAGYIMAGDFASIAETLQTIPTLYPGADADRDMFLSILNQIAP